MNLFPLEIPDSPIFFRSVAVVGALAHFPETEVPFKREAFSALLANYGGRLAPSPEDATAFVICNDPHTPVQATVPIISEKDFFALLQRGCDPGQPEKDFIIRDGTLVKYIGNAPDVIIPDEVVTIGSDAFRKSFRLRSVSIGTGVVFIEEGAFCDCINLQGISLPPSVKYIGDFAFAECNNLLYLSLPEGLEYIGCKAFYEAELLQALVIPSTVTEIGNEAFASCRKIKTLTLSEGVQRVGCSAFAFAKGLRSLTIPDSVRPEAGAFSNCSNLEQVVLPQSWTRIPPSLFAGCTALTSLTIPRQVTIIDNSAFADCKGLRHLNLPTGLRAIGYAAFLACGFRHIRIPGTVTSIGAKAFRCSALQAITIAEGVTSIGDEAFFYCHLLQSIDLPKSLVTLGHNVFHHCHSLRHVSIPETLTDLPPDLFFGCRAMADDFGFLISGSTLISAFLYGRTQLVIPEGITHIRDYALFGIEDLESAVVPPGVTELGDHFLEWIPALKTVILPPEITTLERHTLINCYNLLLLQAPGVPGEMLCRRSVDVAAAAGYLLNPELYTDPDIVAFYRDYLTNEYAPLLSVVFERDWVECLARFASMGFITRENFNIHCLQPALQANATGCVAFLMDWKHNHLTTGSDDTLTEELEKDPLNETDMRQLWRFTELDGGWVITAYEGTDEQILIPYRIGEKPVHQIGPYAFSPENGIFRPPMKEVLCRLTDVSIPSGLTRIRTRAFLGCPRLKRVSIPDTVVTIDQWAFSNCPVLTIHGPAGSYAETYAREHNIPFEAE